MPLNITMRITGEISRTSTAQRASVHDSGAFLSVGEKSHYGIMNRLKTSWRLLHRPFHAPQTFSKKTMYGRIKPLALKMKRSRNYISLLPDDLLIEIFTLAARTLEDKVAMSLVCRRFRAVMMSMRKMWDGYWIEFGQTPEQIIAIAEGNGPTSLKARIKRDSLADRPFSYRQLFESYSLSSYWQLIVSYIPHLRALELSDLPHHRTLPFREVCDVPSLRSLDVDFIPHPSLARRLTRFRFRFGRPREVQPLSELLDFLSSSDALEELVIDFNDLYFGDRSVIDALPAVTMPTIVSCEILGNRYVLPPIGAILVAKLRMPVLRALKLGQVAFRHQLTTAVQDEFRTSLQSMSSLEDLELSDEIYDGINYLDDIIRYAPPHLESFSLKGCRYAGRYYLSGGPSQNTSQTSLVPNRKLIHFRDCTFDCYHTFVDFLREIGLRGVKLQFSGCQGWRDGTFGLDDVMSARVDTWSMFH